MQIEATVHYIPNPTFGEIKTFRRDTGHIVVQQGDDLILMSLEAAEELLASLIEFTEDEDDEPPPGESNVIPFRRAAAA